MVGIPEISGPSGDHHARNSRRGRGDPAPRTGTAGSPARGGAPRPPLVGSTRCRASSTGPSCTPRAGDGGAGCGLVSPRGARRPRAAPTAATAATAGDVWLVADPNQASLLGFRDHPFRRATNGGARAGQAQARRFAGRTSSSRCRSAPRSHPLDGDAAVRPRGPGDRFLVRRGGPGRPRQRAVPLEPPARPGLRRAGRARRGALVRPRAASSRPTSR